MELSCHWLDARSGHEDYVMLVLELKAHGDRLGLHKLWAARSCLIKLAFLSSSYCLSQR